jgi:hypothetical protein
MDYSLYFERVEKGQRVNPYQYDGPDQLPEWEFWIISMLYKSAVIDTEKIIIDQSDNKANFIFSFLDYHFSRFNGNPDQFLICLNTIRQKVEKRKFNSGFEFFKPNHELYTPVIDKWIKENEVKIIRNQAKSEPKRLKVPQIALIHVYEGRQITRENASEIASKYGYKSGEGLFQDYTKYSSLSNRTGDPGTDKKLQNKIKLIESITEHLTGNSKDRAIDEIKILKML